jgi:hypothetical protein
MQNMTKYLKFSFQFDTDKLIHDLSLIFNEKWTSNFNTTLYSSDWKVVSLSTDSENESNIFALSTLSFPY